MESKRDIAQRTLSLQQPGRRSPYDAWKGCNSAGVMYARLRVMDPKTKIQATDNIDAIRDALCKAITKSNKRK